MSKSTWEMVSPVISNAHLPEEHSLDALRGSASKFTNDVVFDIPGGALVFLGVDHRILEDPPSWFLPIIEWMDVEYPGSSWIRFDMDGDEIEELPAYEW